LLPTDLLLDFFKSVEIKGNWRYELRHYLYEGERASSKKILKKVLGMVEFEKMDEKKKEKFELLKRAVESDLHVLKVKKVEVIDYNDWVYDVSIPDNEMFFAGKIPVLLHNSDERGIDVVRGKIKDFARTSPLGEAAFKLIFLDEADALTSDAQAALRRTMERFPRCRFILSCNFSSKIIEPIQSRCAVFRFKPIDSEEIKRYIGYIAQKEGIQITPEGMEALVYLAEGDLRKAINLLQVGASKERRVTEETLYKISSYPDPKVIKGIIKESLEGNFIKARNLLDKLLIEYGLSGEDVLDQIHGAIFNLSLPDDAMVEALGQLGEVAFRIIEGSNPRIQLDALLAKFAQIGKKIKGENESMYRGDI
jgi:replication factor C small subunit